MSAGRGRRRCLALAALALCACCSHAEPLPFGRLFTTPAERQYLDERRRAGQHGASPPARSAAAPLVAPTAQPAAAPANVITFRGFIQGRNGRTAAWLSGGEALARRPATPGAPADQMAVKLPSGAVVRLRPGQSYDPRRGAVLDATGAVP